MKPLLYVLLISTLSIGIAPSPVLSDHLMTAGQLPVIQTADAQSVSAASTASQTTTPMNQPVSALGQDALSASYTPVTTKPQPVIINHPVLAAVTSTPHSGEIMVTAYSSTPDQTDGNPFITASGMHVRDGIIAANFLPFGTEVMLPQLFGNKVFTVEDHMAPSHYYQFDIWMTSRQQALNFGVHYTKFLIVNQ